MSCGFDPISKPTSQREGFRGHSILLRPKRIAIWFHTGIPNAMKLARLHQLLQRGLEKYRVGSFLSLLGAVTRAFSPQGVKYRRAKAKEDTAFDINHGTDTAGITHLETLDTLGPHRAVGTVHIASPRGEFDAALALLDFPLEELTFLDLGSGKGRALLFAAERPFVRIIGVEFARELHETAARNLSILASDRQDATNVELVRADAATYPLPQTPLLIFLFNPFGPPVIDLVARHALESWREHPRFLRILYMNPVHLQNVVAAGWTVLRLDNGAALLAPAES